jgi:hypothetical protein
MQSRAVIRLCIAPRALAPLHVNHFNIIISQIGVYMKQRRKKKFLTSHSNQSKMYLQSQRKGEHLEKIIYNYSIIIINRMCN